MIFRPLFEAESSTFTYLLGDPATRQAVLVDPVVEQIDRDLQFIHELGLTLTHVFDTHVHADHVTAAGEIRERTGATVVGGVGGAPCADVHAKHGDQIRVGELVFTVLATPGHTDDSVSYLIGDRVFTGDALLVRANGRTDFQNGNAGQLYDSITQVLFALPDETLVYPGHDYKGRTVSSIAEEKRHNPRLAGRSRDEFVRLMSELQLAPPRKIDVAVPANRHCGRTAWIEDVSASDLERIRGVRRIDVREPDEFTGPLGHLPDAELVPLNALEQASTAWAREEPLLLICRSGKRSANAAKLLAQRGFLRLYNLTGGMLAVRESVGSERAS